MGHIKLLVITYSIFFWLPNLSIAQTKYKLVFFNFESNVRKFSTDTILTIYDIESNQKIKYQTRPFSGQFHFLTDKKNVRIEIVNDFNQKIDTVISLNKQDTIHKLFLNKFKDYDIETCVENSIKSKKKWSLEYSFNGIEGMGMSVQYNSRIKLRFKKGKVYVVYNRKDMGTQKVVLDKMKQKLLIQFEKKLKLMNRQERYCQNSSYYSYKSGFKKFSIEDNTCLFKGAYSILLSQLGFE